VNYLRALASAMLLLAAPDAAAQIVEYRVSGTMVKEPLSDNLFNSKSSRVAFDIRFTADTARAIKVPAGTRTSLPSFPDVVLPHESFLLPATAVTSFAFRAAGVDASFSSRDVIANDSTGASILLTGSLDRPTGINLMLANGVSGYVEFGILECAPRCAFRGGIVLDRAGPFGTIQDVVITARKAKGPKPRTGSRSGSQ
jgi:hypothetical protein